MRVKFLLFFCVVHWIALSHDLIPCPSSFPKDQYTGKAADPFNRSEPALCYEYHRTEQERVFYTKQEIEYFRRDCSDTKCSEWRTEGKCE